MIGLRDQYLLKFIIISDFHGYMLTREEVLVFVFGSRASSILQEPTIIKSKRDIDEFVEKIVDLFRGRLALETWFEIHNSSRHFAYSESEFRPYKLCAMVLYVTKL